MAAPQNAPACQGHTLRKGNMLRIRPNCCEIVTFYRGTVITVPYDMNM